ncbi:MAG: Ig-like domain-containing protein [Prevotella sp.]|nr:Ig-like domain-containing protein [Prevotella sp.]
MTITYLDPDGTVEDPTLTIDNDFSLVVGQTKNLTVNTNSDGTVTYESSDTDVATVANGVVTAVAAGSATITVNVAAAEWYNAASETVDVTVVEKAVQSVTVAGLKTSYATGDDFVASCTVTANYNDNTSAEVAAADYTMTVTKDNVAVTDLTNLAAGTYYATVTYSGVSSDPIEIKVSDNGGGGTYKMTPNQSSTGSTSASYITTLTEFTYDGITWKMNQWNPSTLQIKTNQSSAASEFRFYNTSAFSGRISKVVITFSALTVLDASKLMFLGGTSEVTETTGGTAGTWDSTNKTLTWTPASTDNFTYFAFYQNGKAASGTNNLATSDAIVVTYE